MAVMGFTHDPGPLPFTTIRDAKWANRLEGIPFVEIQGEHGCTMSYQVARVASVEPFVGECPAHLADVYKGKRLVAVHLTPPKPCLPGEHQESPERRVCVKCGMTAIAIAEAG
jgi:hypothetical protein